MMKKAPPRASSILTSEQLKKKADKKRAQPLKAGGKVVVADKEFAKDEVDQCMLEPSYCSHRVSFWPQSLRIGRRSCLKRKEVCWYKCAGSDCNL
jgi:hypothetical protein